MVLPLRSKGDQDEKDSKTRVKDMFLKELYRWGRRSKGGYFRKRLIKLLRQRDTRRGAKLTIQLYGGVKRTDRRNSGGGEVDN